MIEQDVKRFTRDWRAFVENIVLENVTTLCLNFSF